MLMEDYELEMNKFKYLAMFTNPEAYQQLEGNKSEKYSVKNSMAVGGEVNRERAKQLNDDFNRQLNIKVDNKTEIKDNGIDII